MVNPKNTRIFHLDATFCPVKDRPYYEQYIQTKQSVFTKIHITRGLTDFYDFIIDHYPRVNSILKVTPQQFRAYFEYLDHRALQKDIKTKTRQNLKAFIFWIISPDLIRGKLPKYRDELIFMNNFYRFRESGTTHETVLLSKEDILECIRFFQDRNFRVYLMVKILAYTGMRIGGMINIRIDQIDLEQRKITTQEKPTTTHNGINEYCIALPLMADLQSYLLEVQLKNPGQEFLFPMSTTSVRNRIHKWKKKQVHPHAFRDALNTRWAELGLEMALRDVLMNHEASAINSKHYLKKYRNWEEKLTLYDQYFPY
jgi:integrase